MSHTELHFREREGILVWNNLLQPPGSQGTVKSSCNTVWCAFLFTTFAYVSLILMCLDVEMGQWHTQVLLLSPLYLIWCSKGQTCISKTFLMLPCTRWHWTALFAFDFNIFPCYMHVRRHLLLFHLQHAFCLSVDTAKVHACCSVDSSRMLHRNKVDSKSCQDWWLLAWPCSMLSKLLCDQCCPNCFVSSDLLIFTTMTGLCASSCTGQLQQLSISCRNVFSKQREVNARRTRGKDSKNLKSEKKQKCGAKQFEPQTAKKCRLHETPLVQGRSAKANV